MIRKTLTILSLLGLLLSVGAWGVSYLNIGCLVGGKHFLAASAGSLHLGTLRGGIGQVEFSWHQRGDRLVLASQPTRHPAKCWMTGYGTLKHVVEWPLVVNGRTTQFFAQREKEIYTLTTQLRPTFWRYPGQWGIGVPFWMPMALCGIVICYFHLTSHVRSNRRRKLGLCLKCGYDLRASKDKRPECGQGF